MTDYENLSDRQLVTKSEVELQIMIPCARLDDNAARLIRNRIAELGLQKAFWNALKSQLDALGDHWIFDVLQATARQQAIAALIAMEETNAK